MFYNKTITVENVRFVSLTLANTDAKILINVDRIIWIEEIYELSSVTVMVDGSAGLLYVAETFEEIITALRGKIEKGKANDKV